MSISESTKLKKLEDKYLISRKCEDKDSSTGKNESLSLDSFWVLFSMTIGTSTLALLINIIMRMNEFRKSKPEHTNLFDLMAFIKAWQRQRQMRQSSTIVSNVELTYVNSE